MKIKRKHNLKKQVIVSIVFTLVCCFFVGIGLQKKDKLVYSFDSKDVKAGEYERVVYDDIKLEPGVYRIVTDYSYETRNSQMYIAYYTPRDSSVGKNKLRSTGSYLYLNKNVDSQEFYLYEKTYGLKVSVTAYYDDFTIDSLKIFDTGKLWFCLATRFAFLYVIVMIIIQVINGIRAGKISNEVVRRWIAFFAIWILSALPWLCGLTILTPDGPYHMERVEGVANALRTGQFPVRIEPSWLQGYGFANGLYYSDLFLTFPAILRILGFSVTESFNAYLLTVNALIIIVSNYSFRKIIKNENISLIMTAMYALSEVKYYQFMRGGAIGEGTALVFLPLVLLGFYEIFYEENKQHIKWNNKKGWIYLSIGYTGLISCHILSTEITIAVSILFVLMNIRKLFIKNSILEIIRAAIFTSLTTLWFSIPFLESYINENINIKYAYSRKIQDAGLYPLQLLINFFGRFQEEGGGITGFTKIGIGPVLLVSLVAFIVIIIVSRKKEEYRCFFVSTSLIAIVLTVFSTNVFPWDYLQDNVGFLKALISAIQFPLRFLEWATLMLIVVFGYVTLKIKEIDNKFVISLLAIFASLGIAFSLIARIDYYNMDVLKYPLGNFDGIRTDYVAGGEYVLRGTDISLLEYSKIGSGENIEYENFFGGMLSGSMFVRNNGNEDSYVEFPLLNYRHYKAKDNDGNQLRIVNGDNNVVRVIIPPSFSGNIFVKYTPPFYWHICEIISLISVITFVALMFRKEMRKREAVNNVG